MRKLLKRFAAVSDCKIQLEYLANNGPFEIVEAHGGIGENGTVEERLGAILGDARRYHGDRLNHFLNNRAHDEHVDVELIGSKFVTSPDDKIEIPGRCVVAAVLCLTTGNLEVFTPEEVSEIQLPIPSVAVYWAEC